MVAVWLKQINGASYRYCLHTNGTEVDPDVCFWLVGMRELYTMFNTDKQQFTLRVRGQDPIHQKNFVRLCKENISKSYCCMDQILFNLSTISYVK
jgi:hypothetical protein